MAAIIELPQSPFWAKRKISLLLASAMTPAAVVNT
jgi:hypothetical protein